MGPSVLVMLKRTVHYWFLLFYKSIFSVYMFYIPHSDTCIYSAGNCSAFDLYKLKNKQKNPQNSVSPSFHGVPGHSSYKVAGFWLPCPHLCGKCCMSIINPGPVTGRRQLSGG